MIATLLYRKHKSTKLHLETKEMGENLSNKLNMFWQKIYKVCECLVKIESYVRCLKDY